MALYIHGCHCTWILPNFRWGVDALCTPHLGVVGQVCCAPYSNILRVSPLVVTSLAIILPIHLHLVSLASTFATVSSNHYTYAYQAERRRTCPYTIIAFSVNRYVSLTGFREFTPLPTRHIIKSTIDVTAFKSR